MTSTPTESDPILEEAMLMLQRDLDMAHIRENLLKSFMNETEVERVMKLISNHKSLLRRRRGGILCAAGAILFVLGCVFALFCQDLSGLTRMTIYLPPIIGSGLILWGFVDLLGW